MARRFFLIIALTGLLAGMSGGAARAQALPDEATLARLVWSTMIALDNANRTNNYTMIYALGSDSFRAQNGPLALSQTFAPMRNARVDLGKAILIAPRYHIQPAIDSGGLMRLRGSFDFRPRAILFDLLFEFRQGGWQLFGLSVAESG